MSQQVLVFQNDPELPRTLRYVFDSLNFQVALTSEPSEALEILATSQLCLVLLDLAVPDNSGRDLCKEIRARASPLPILVLSEEVDVVEKVLLFEAGADDSIIKPYNPRELLARVRVALRRNSAKKETARRAYRFDEIEVNFETMELFRAGKAVPLTRQEFKVLRFFLCNQHRVCSRNELLNEVWGYQSYPTTRTVDTHIFRLRQKLERDPVDPVYFQTVHGTGYKFVAS